MEKIKQKKGISLIVLVITIIVMIVLASAIILSLSSSGIIDRANIAKTKSDQANIEEMANTIKTEALLECQHKKEVLTQDKLLELIQKSFETSAIEGNVIIVDNQYDIVVDDKLKINVVKSELQGNGQTFNTFAPSDLAFKSNAKLADFQQVKINGETLDESNYTLTEGSTIVTLKSDYLKTLHAGKHEITIASKTSTRSAKFSIMVPTQNSHGFYYNQPYLGYVTAYGGYWIFFFREDGSMDFTNIYSGLTEVCSYEIVENTIVVSSSIGTFSGTVSEDGRDLYCNEVGETFRLDNSKAVADAEYIYVYDSSLGGYIVNPIEEMQPDFNPIPANINNIPIVKISIRAFAHCINEGIIENDILDNAPLVPNSITCIGEDAFNSCIKLKSITIPASVTSIENKAFYNCISLNDIKFEGTIEQWNSISFGDYWNGGVPATEVKCSNGVVSLK